MTSTEEAHPTKPRAAILERFSWLPLALALLAGSVWSVMKFRSHSAQSVIFLVGTGLLLSVELVRVLRSRRRGEAGIDRSTFADGATSFAIGMIFTIGSAMIVFPLLYAFAKWVHSHAIFHVDQRLEDVFGGAAPYIGFVLLFIAVDFTYYWAHRSGHKVELFWANHSVHHSSEHYNPSTAVRISFLDEAWDLVLVSLWALLGFDPLTLFVVYGFVMLYQLPMHVTWVGRLPRPIEFVLNTPEHHRAHHARQKIYIDQNFSGVFILWDRIFDTYVDVDDVDPLYGLTIPVGTFRPVPVLFHENAHMVSKMVHADSFGTAVQYPFRRPYWEPEAH